MRANTFNNSSPSCPVCHSNRGDRSHRSITGLLTCQHCRERLVVSWSGHYVRDPFITKQRQTELLLRRRSHPLARIWRNLNQPLSLLLFTALGSAICIGFASILLPDVPKPVINQQHPTQKDIQSP